MLSLTVVAATSIGVVIGIVLAFAAIALGLWLESRDERIREEAERIAAELIAGGQTNPDAPGAPPELAGLIAAARHARSQVREHGGTF